MKRFYIQNNIIYYDYPNNTSILLTASYDNNEICDCKFCDIFNIDIEWFENLINELQLKKEKLSTYYIFNCDKNKFKNFKLQIENYLQLNKL